VDEHGLPRRIALTAGQAHDNRAVQALLTDLPAGADVVADRSYDANATLNLIEAAGANAHIPTPRRRRVQRSVDPAIYRRRNLIERCFCKLKHNRGVATRYAKLARNYLAALCLAAVRLWTRFESTT
jgi:transposase